jgi:hypothetical protein
MEVSGQLYASADSPSVKIEEEARRRSEPGGKEKNPCLAGYRTSIVQLIISHFTDSLNSYGVGL